MDWKCIQDCDADCCGIVPLKEDMAKRNEGLQQVSVTEIIRLSDSIVPVTEDMRCVFLDRSTKRCAVYNERPEICKRYGQVITLPCPYIRMSGMSRSPREVLYMKIWILNHVEQFINRLKLKYPCR